jgi:hypothetical protein
MAQISTVGHAFCHIYTLSARLATRTKLSFDRCFDLGNTLSRRVFFYSNCLRFSPSIIENRLENMKKLISFSRTYSKYHSTIH